MISRWRLTIVVFVLCALAVVEGLGWVTYQAVSLGRSEARARAEAAFQESIRLALWRMESELTPVLAAEAARPYFHYRAFYPAERAYTNMWREIEPGEVLFASPLLETSGPYIRLHFEVSPDGAVSSPQVPLGPMRVRAAESYVDDEFIVYHERLLSELALFVTAPQKEAAQYAGAAGEVERQGALPSGDSEDAGLKQDLEPGAQQGAVGKSRREYEVRQQQAENVQKLSEQYRGPARSAGQQAQAPPPAATAELARKDSGAQDSLRAKEPIFDKSEADAAESPTRLLAATGGAAPTDSAPAPGALSAVWRIEASTGTPQLLVERTVRVADRDSVQGFWMDWPALKSRLLASVTDLLPKADLEPVGLSPADPALPAAAERGQLLASIPVLLVPGPVPPPEAGLWGPTQVTLVFTWLAVLAAIAAIGVVLRAAMRLSDRRGRFVSAVTHELRTPLTTFCLYTEMLADDIVREEPARREYLVTLKNESRRLARIVESVLDYARLGRRKHVAPAEPVAVQEILDRAVPALRSRADLDDMRLDMLAPSMEGVLTRVDPQTFERVLFNLVDNACKYAAEGSERTIHLSAHAERSRVEFRVRDHGPGVPRGEEERIFQPFHRARRDAEGPRAGLGLGLALARGLAREMGGDLTYSQPRSGGAEFVLRLPREARRG